MDCDFNKGPGPEQICKVNVEGLFQGPCTNETQYGWKAGTPCIAIKLNKVRYQSHNPFFASLGSDPQEKVAGRRGSAILHASFSAHSCDFLVSSTSTLSADF